MNITNLRLSDTIEDLQLQKYITENIDKASKLLGDVIEDINTRVYNIVTESNELDISIDMCPSFIEFSARYSFNDTDKLRSTIREFFQTNLKNKTVLLEDTLDNIISISVPMVECLSEEGIYDDLEHALYFVGNNTEIVNEENYKVKLTESAYDVVLSNLNGVITLIEELENEEVKVLNNLKESPEKVVDFYKYCEITRQLCENLNKLQ